MGSVTRASIVFFTLLSFLCGCNRSDEQIKVYRLAKPSGEAQPLEKDAIASTNAPVKSTLERSANSNEQCADAVQLGTASIVRNASGQFSG